MRKFHIIVISLLFLSITASAQVRKEVSCTFSQTKRSGMLAEALVSRGKMYFSPPDKVRWEYISPVQTVFIMTADKACIISEGKKKDVDMAGNGLYRSISDIMSAGMNEGDGRYQVERNGDTLTMIPLRKDMKRVFSSVKIVNGKDGFPVSVLISEKNGDSTTIVFSDIDSSGVNPEVFNF